jgi:hypothetical protein
MEKVKASSGKGKGKRSSSASDVTDVSVPAAQTMLQVYLWTEKGGDAPQSAREMVVDLLGASPCVVRDGYQSPIHASFTETPQAVKAAWRLRRLVRGFSEASRAGRLGACFILSNLAETHPEVPLLKRFPVLTKVNSGQVLLVGSLCESMREVPGFRFEAVSDEWMTPEVVGYGSVLQLCPPLQMDGYVAEPSDHWAPAVETKSQTPVVEEVPPPTVATKAVMVEEITVVAPRPVAESVVGPLAHAETQGFSGTKRAARGMTRFAWIGLGCAAVVALTTIAIRVSSSRRSEAPAPQPPAVVRSISSTPTAVPAKMEVPSSPSSPVKADEPTAVLKPGKLDARDVRDAANAIRKGTGLGKGQAIDGEDAAADGRKGGVDRTGITFSSDEINRTIALADRESGDGKFDDAIRTYRIVLKHDPSNARAREGLERAIRNKQSQ